MRQTRKNSQRQASKLAEIREALIAAGYNSAAKQADVLGPRRSTAWALLNRDTRAGPTATVIKRILSSRNIPPEVRRKIKSMSSRRSAACTGITSGRCGHFAISSVTGLPHLA